MWRCEKENEKYKGKYIAFYSQTENKCTIYSLTFCELIFEFLGYVYKNGNVWLLNI